MIKDAEKQSEKKKIPTTGSTWSGFWIKLRRLLPFMWPSDNPWLQLRVVFCVFLLISVRVREALNKNINKFGGNLHGGLPPLPLFGKEMKSFNYRLKVPVGEHLGQN